MTICPDDGRSCSLRICKLWPCATPADKIRTREVRIALLELERDTAIKLERHIFAASFQKQIDELTRECNTLRAAA